MLATESMLTLMKRCKRVLFDMCTICLIFCFFCRMASYDRAFRSLGLPADFVISDGANYDLIVFPATGTGPSHGGHGHFSFIIDDDHGYSYGINRRREKACYLKCIKRSCNARRILYYADPLVSFSCWCYSLYCCVPIVFFPP